MIKGRISVIIPTYNRAKNIGNAITSVLSQTNEDFELIIVDDGSSDNTKEVIESFNDQRIQYHYQENSERGAARNTGLKLAKGEYVTFLDSDDIFYSNHLSEALKIIPESHPIFCLGYRITSKNGEILNEENHNNRTQEELIEGNFLSCIGVFVNSEVIKNDPFDESRVLSGFEDWELWIRMASKYQIKFFNRITSAMINHDNRSVNSINKQALMERADIFLKKVENNPVIMQKFGDKINVLRGSVFTYVSLHLAMDGRHKLEAVKFLHKGIKANLSELFKRRFLAIIKNLILS